MRLPIASGAMLLAAGLAVLGLMSALILAGLQEAPYWTNDIWAGGHTSNASRPPGQSPVTTTDAMASNPPLAAARARAWVLTNASIGWSSACQSSCPQSITQRPTR